MTPEEEAELLRKLTSYGEDFGASPARDVTTPAVPVRPPPDIEGAAMDTRRAVRNTLSLSQPRTAPEVAERTVRDLLARPEPVPEKPTLGQSATKALSPQRATRDDRPPAQSATLMQSVADWATDRGASSIALDLLQPGYTIARDYITPAARGVAERLTDKDITVPASAEGAKTENAALWLLRVLGTAAPAIVLETVERTPTPDIRGAREQLADVETGDAMAGLAAIVDAFWTSPSTFGEQYMAVTPGEFQRVRRTGEGFGADWAQGVLERIERGSGLEQDMEASFARKFGPNAANVGWMAGLGLDMVTNWEGALASAPRAVARVAATTKRLGDITPTGLEPGLNKLAAAIQGHEISYTREVAARISDGLQSGRITVEDLPQEWRLRLDEVATIEGGAPIRELLRQEAENVGSTTAPHLSDAPAARAADFIAHASAEPDAAILPGEGFRRLQRDAEAMPVDDPAGAVYVVRDGDGGIVSEPLSLRAARDTAAQRAARGDQIWQGDRPVAVWRELEGEGPELVAHPWFAGPREIRATSAMRNAPGPQGLSITAAEPPPPRELAAIEYDRLPEPIPPFEARTAADFYRRASKYRDAVIEPGEGFRRLSRDAPELNIDAPDTARYVLRDGDGNLVDAERYTLAGAKQLMASRSRRGEQIWQGPRPVAVWRESAEDGPELVAHPWFAGPLERNAMPAQLRAGGAQLRELVDPPRPAGDGGAVGSELLRVYGDAPPREKGVSHYPYKVDERHVRDVEAEAAQFAEEGATQYWRVGLVPVGDFTSARGTQPDKLRNVVDLMKAGTELPPVEAGRTLDGLIEAADGHHRISASRKLGYTHVPARELVVVDKYGITPKNEESIFPEMRAGPARPEPPPKVIPEETQLAGLRAERATTIRTLEQLEAKLQLKGLDRKVRKATREALPNVKKRLGDLEAKISGIESKARTVAAEAKKKAELTKAAKASPPPELFAEELPRAFGPPPSPERIRIEARPMVAAAIERGLPPDFYGTELARIFEPPPSPRPVSTRPGSALHSLVHSAGRLVAADSLFTDRLRMLPNTALVPMHEAERIQSLTRRAVGIDVDDARKLIASKTPMDEAQLKAIRRWVPDADEVLTTRTWMAAQHAATGAVSRSMADVRYRVRGLRPLRERMLLSFKDAHTGRVADSIVSRAAKRAPLRWIAQAFTTDVLARLPPGPRAAWKRLQSAWERNADELAREVKADGAPRVLERIIEHYRPAVPADLDIADRILTTTRNADDAVPSFHRTMNRVLEDWTHPPPDIARLIDEGADEARLITEARKWARSMDAAAGEHGRDWLRAVSAAAGRDSFDAIDALDNAAARRVYTEVASGELSGPATMEALTKLGIGTVDESDALIHYALYLRQKALLSETAREMVGGGAAVLSDDPRLPVLASVLTGQYRTRKGDRWVYNHTDAEVTWALRQLRDWGVEPGSGIGLSSRRVGSSSITAPSFILEEIGSLRSAGFFDNAAIDSRQLTPFGAYNALMKVYKESLTHGILAPNPAHIVGQAIGMLPTLVTTRGLGGAASTAATGMWRQPRMTAELVRRAGGIGVPLIAPRTPDEEILRVADALYSVDDLEQVARAHGLFETHVDFESAAELQALIGRAERSWFDPRNIAEPARWWQEVIRRFAGAADLNARVATFLDGVSKGMPLDEAAAAAKAATLDYRALTKFESRHMRAAFTFYAFARKNADAHMLSLIMHPERLSQQARMAHASLTQGLGLTGVEVGNLTDQDMGRLTLYTDREVTDKDGRTQPHYRLNRITTPPISIVEWMGFMGHLAPWKGPGGIFGSDNRELLQMASPLLQTIAIGLQGRKLDRTFQTAQSNFVPPVLLEGPMGELVQDYFGIGPEPLTSEDDPALEHPDATRALNVRSRWSAGGKYVLEGNLEAATAARARWQMFSVWFARPVGQLELAAEALGIEKPPPFMTQSDAVRDLLLGTKTRPVLAEPEILQRRDEELVKKLNRTTRAVGLPKGVGPR